MYIRLSVAITSGRGQDRDSKIQKQFISNKVWYMSVQATGKGTQSTGKKDDLNTRRNQGRTLDAHTALKTIWHRREGKHGLNTLRR